jgi:hypothetical protein
MSHVYVGGKAPRQWAAEIIALRTKAERNAALRAVPEEWRDRVQHYVTDHFARRKYARKTDLVAPVPGRRLW